MILIETKRFKLTVKKFVMCNPLDCGYMLACVQQFEIQYCLLSCWEFLFCLGLFQFALVWSLSFHLPQYMAWIKFVSVRKWLGHLFLFYKRKLCGRNGSLYMSFNLKDELMMSCSLCRFLLGVRWKCNGKIIITAKIFGRPPCFTLVQWINYCLLLVYCSCFSAIFFVVKS